MQHPVEMVAFTDGNLADKVLPVCPLFVTIRFPIEFRQNGVYRQIELIRQFGELDPLLITE